jgi:hypothetical protein
LEMAYTTYRLGLSVFFLTAKRRFITPQRYNTRLPNISIMIVSSMSRLFRSVNINKHLPILS